MTNYLVGTYSEGSYRGQYWMAVLFDPETRKISRMEYGSMYYPLREKLPDRAPDDVMALFKRVNGIRARWHKRSEDIKEARRLGLEHYSYVHKLRYALNEREFDAVLPLLKAKSFRSAFRASLAEQVRGWLKDPNPKFQKPLSRKQFGLLVKGK